MTNNFDNSVYKVAAVTPASIPFFSFEWWQITIILLVTGMIIAFLLILINKITNGNFKLFNILSVKKKETKKETEEETNYSVHSICEHKYSLEYPITKLSEISSQILDIKNRGILGDQMKKVEQYLLNLKNYTMNVVSQYLKNYKDIKDPTKFNIDYKNFKLIFTECLSKVKDILRESCIKNGFDSKNNVDYDNYVDDIVNVIVGEINNFLNENFYTTDTLIVSELLEYKIDGLTLVEYYTKCFKKIYDDLKDISIVKYNEINLLLEQKKKIYLVCFGIAKDDLRLL